MTNNNPHVRSYMSNKEIQEYINEHNNRLNSLYNPKAINISYLFINNSYYIFKSLKILSRILNELGFIKSSKEINEFIKYYKEII